MLREHFRAIHQAAAVKRRRTEPIERFRHASVTSADKRI